jgi:hypothetical protein
VVFVVGMVFWLIVALIGYFKLDWQIGACLLVFFFGLIGLVLVYAFKMKKRSEL